MANASFSKSAFRIHHSSFRIFEVVFPQIEVQTVTRWRGGPPEFTGVKAHGVKRLGLFTLPVGNGVGIDKRAMHPGDDSTPPTHIPGQACMARRMNVPCDDMV